MQSVTPPLSKKVPVQFKPPTKKTEKVPVQQLPAPIEKFSQLNIVDEIEKINVLVPLPQLLQVPE